MCLIAKLREQTLYLNNLPDTVQNHESVVNEIDSFLDVSPLMFAMDVMEWWQVSFVHRL